MVTTTESPYAYMKSRWEFWPGYVRDLPVYLFWLWFSFRSGHPFFFSNVNPGMIFSGFVEVDKREHLKYFDAEHVPQMFVAGRDESIRSIEQKLKEK